MKKIASRIVLLFILLYLPQNVSAARMLVPVGQVIGLELGCDRVFVAGFDDENGKNLESAGLRVGDELLQIDNVPIHSAGDVLEALNHARGTVEVQVKRGAEELKLRLTPAITPSGPRLGVYLRQGITGIGTVTWYDPDSGTFGALGHGVNSVQGQLIQMEMGNAYAARVQSVKKGRVGEPGQLLGAITEATPVGTLRQNTSRGIFGKCESGWPGQEIPLAEPEAVTTGSATILSTIQGQEPREYSVEILKIYPESRQDGRNLLLRITDPRLLAATGGIVQGMSGSPIIQNGKLVGAVTHVLVNDPTRGYGIFIENMLQAAG